MPNINNNSGENHERIDDFRNQELYKNYIKTYSDQSRPKWHWSPWLLIRSATTDLGIRPLPLEFPYYLSPDIWIESSDPLGRPVVGEHNFIHVNILNLGMAGAAPVKVDFFWGDPSLGLGRANLIYVGSEWVEVMSQEVKDVKCNTPWIPIYLNQGHECIVVNCSNPIGDPIIHPFESWMDRHVGQRNVTVIEASGGDLIKFDLKINNLFPIKAQTSISALVRHIIVDNNTRININFRALFNKVIFNGVREIGISTEMLKDLKFGSSEYHNAIIASKYSSNFREDKTFVTQEVNYKSRIPRDIGKVSCTISDSSIMVKPPEPGRFLTSFLHSKDRSSSNFQSYQEEGINLKNIALEPFEQRSILVEMQVPNVVKPDEYLTFQFTQSAQDFCLGGYCIIVKIIDKKQQKT